MGKFILDNGIIYHCGASVNKIGYKMFSITLINDDFIIKTLLDRINKIIKQEKWNCPKMKTVN